MRNLGRAAGLTLLLGAALAAYGDSSDQPRSFIDESEITWKVNQFNVARWKTLIGGIEGGQIDAEDVQFGLWELAPRAIYHGHKHAAPEIYYVLSGRVLWTVGEQSQEVGSGSAIYTKPGQVHRMENLTDQPAQAIWIWWAPGGDKGVFLAPYEFTEPAPNQLDEAHFSSPSQRKY